MWIYLQLPDCVLVFFADLDILRSVWSAWQQEDAEALDMTLVDTLEELAKNTHSPNRYLLFSCMYISKRLPEAFGLPRTFKVTYLCSTWYTVSRMSVQKISNFRNWRVGLRFVLILIKIGHIICARCSTLVIIHLNFAIVKFWTQIAAEDLQVLIGRWVVIDKLKSKLQLPIAVHVVKGERWSLMTSGVTS